ncbi:MAG TPA: tetratricopeptide repeat protein [Methylomirabilota bacterium]
MGDRRRPDVASGPSGAAPRSTAIDLLAPLLAAAAAVLAFLPALGGEFLTFDDFQKLRYNPRIRGLGWRELEWMWTTTYTGLYQPLAWMTWAVDFRLWEHNPAGYHLTSLLCHGVTAALVYRLARRLFEVAGAVPAGAPRGTLALAAAVSALLFAVHPLRAEPVVWISARGDVLAGLFAVAATLAYLNAVGPAPAPGRRRGWGWYGTALGLFACALLSKASPLSLPLAWLVLDVYPLRRLGSGPGGWLGPAARRVWAEKLPFAGVAALVALLAALGKARSDAMLPSAEASPIARLGQALYAAVFYVRTTLVPVGISPLYERPAELATLTGPFLASAVAVAAVTVGLVATRRRWPAALAAWAAYLALLAPTSGIVSYGSQLVAARYSYLACVPWAVLAAAVVPRLAAGPGGRRLGRPGRAAAAAALALLVVGLGALSWRQARIWRDSESLWTYTLEVVPGSAVAHVELGLLAERRGDFAGGAAHFRQALARWPGARLQDVAIASSLEREGQHGAAAAHYRNALALAPGSRTLGLALGRALALSGQLDAAADHLTALVARFPDLVEGRVMLAIVELRRNQPGAAISELRAALALAPDSALAHYHLAAALRRTGQPAEADAHLRRARALDPRLDALASAPGERPDGGTPLPGGAGATP